MLFRMTEPKYAPNPVLERALEVLFILHADHEQNCSTSTMRAIGSSHADPYSALAGAAAALYGPLHGGANEAVLRMLAEIGSMNNIPAFIKRVKAGEGRLMGFGHRVYKSYDPRAKIIKRMADLVFDVTGKNPLLEMALELERIALEDEYFVSRKLYPNVDFYSGLIYQAMGFPVDMFPVLFAIPRTAGWIAQWEEMLNDPGSEDRPAAPDLHRARRRATTCPGEAPVTRRADGSGPHKATKLTKITKSFVVFVFFVAFVAAAVARCSAQSQAAPKFDGDARVRGPQGAWSRSGRGPSGSPALEKTRDYIRKQLVAAGLKPEEQAFDAQTPIGVDPHGQHPRDAARSGAGQGPHRHRRPLRHQAVQRHPRSSAPATARRAPPSCSSSRAR